MAEDDAGGDAGSAAPRSRWLSPYAAAMMLIGAGLGGWLLAEWSWPWQAIVVLLGVAVLAFWRAVPRSHDDDGAVL